MCQVIFWASFGFGEIEVDESYFGAKRVRGKRGRGTGGKTKVFGIKKRGNKVYTQIVEQLLRCRISSNNQEINPW
jgi:transposase-like protein